ncbi:DUF4268 domain-containing protein [Chitinophaga deserti]|uniref:DUF4268 domain-containing protein n=1 Tax=Chitinophaga deserti TaxID=2164099 RepID=UPI0018E55670|nr:DUF4268 domain-containing protein [Chitinophaga deserti]
MYADFDHSLKLQVLYSKEEASRIREEFWTTFGQYIAPQPSAEGLRINWINYKTGIRHLFFKMEAGSRGGVIAIESTHPDEGIQELVMEQFTVLKNMLAESLQEEWIWEPHVQNAQGKIVSRIYREIDDVSVFRKEDWPALISFFKPRIMALDDFWSTAKYAFEIFNG